MFGVGGAFAARPAGALAQASRGLPPLKITDVRTILTQPGADHLVIVKVLTSEPGALRRSAARRIASGPLAVADGDQRVPEAIRDRQECRGHRGHLAVGVRVVLLPQRGHAEQRAGRRGRRAVGHRGQAGGDAGVQTAGREGARGGSVVRACERQRTARAGGSGSQVHGGGIPACARATGGSGFFRLRSGCSDIGRGAAGAAAGRGSIAGV